MRLGKDMLYLSRNDVELLNIQMNDFINAMEKVYIEKGKETVIMPAKSPMHPREFASITAMPACIPSLHASGVKIISGFTSNYAIGMDYIHGLYVLTCVDTGAPLAVMDCVWLTGMRTGAVTGMTAKYLARKDSETVTIIGCGMQGYVSLDALMCVLSKLKTIYIKDIKEATIKKYIETMKTRYPSLQIIPATKDYELEAAVKQSDIIITCVPSDINPDFEVIHKDWLIKDGLTCLPVDVGVSFKPECLKRDLYNKMYIDDLRQYHHFQEEGYAKLADINPPEIGKMLIGAVPGRESDHEKILAINIGTGLADLGAAKLIYDQAVAKEIGQIISL